MGRQRVSVGPIALPRYMAGSGWGAKVIIPGMWKASSAMENVDRGNGGEPGGPEIRLANGHAEPVPVPGRDDRGSAQNGREKTPRPRTKLGRDGNASAGQAAGQEGIDPLALAQGLADPGRKEAPDDPDAQEKWPGITFLLAMSKDLGMEFCDSGGISVFPRGGAYQWSIRAPGINRKVSGQANSLTTLLDEMEAAYRSGKALVSILNKAKESKFQERRNKS